MIADWSGKGNMFGMENYRKFFHEEVNDILEERAPLRTSQGLFNQAQICCQVSRKIDPKTKAWDFFGTNTMRIYDTHEVIHSRLACMSLVEGWGGEFTWIWETGRSTGMSSTPKFQPSMEN
ncbi:hypothetical protein PJI16_00655 [Nitrospira sp. MA-1]|nr:hypothetical protein [Nitrospira sp. MA-1]